ncbi:MAG: DUF1080 domain-containing protein [Candidatus Omnitrophota bacterium]
MNRVPMREKILAASFALLVLAALLGVATCVTFSPRHLAFEEQIKAFVRESKPGSEMQIFNGHDLSGWAVHGLGSWTVADGVLTVRRGLGYLATRCEDFGDFVLTLDIRVSKNGNSGVFFHSPHARSLWPWPKGFESQVDNHDPKNPTGSLYNHVRARSLLSRDDEWFEMKIAAIGESISLAISGETVVEATFPAPMKSFIALQAHDPFSRVDFKNIRLRIPDETTRE